MTPERWRQVNALFRAVVDRAPSDRQAVLDATARSDPDLAADVRSLLEAHDSGDWLEQPTRAGARELRLDPSPALPPGAQAGPYRIEREIGRGGMGIVYEAEDTRLLRRVALKALPTPFARDPVRRERLMREARAAAALAHPGIATVYALDEIDGTLFLVAELVRGETLRDEVRRGPLPADRLRVTLAQLAAGLAAAHAAGIVHRDFKPENIVRCADGRVKILDFGLARHVGPAAVTELALTESGIALGTPGYMAPEQLAGGPVDARADVFAFGVVSWELSTGVHPFGTTAAESLGRVTDAVGGRHPTPRPVFPIPGLDAIVRRCLATDPAERYPSAVELSRTLAELESWSAPAGHTAAPEQSLFWWQIHQACLAVVVASMPVACWFVRRHEALVGSAIFLGVLALATVAVATRLNLLFTSRAHRDRLGAQHARVRGTLVGVEAMLALILTLAAALVAGENDPLAGVLVGLAAGTVVSLWFIEPATTSVAMGAQDT